MFPLRTILHPTDFSESSAMALRLACSLARDHGARLVLLHVVPPPVVVFEAGLVTEPGWDYPELINKLRDLATENPQVATEPHVVEGDPATEIVRLAGKVACDMVVMGTHGRTGLRRLLMGSVAESVLRKAPCPVLTVKHPAGPGAETPAANKA
jgi:nucleotide-binding universal stress UspA family protein